MNKANSTKKALVASIVALCLCFTMLVGTTFAWFTDSVTSSGNIIQSGTLDVEMYWANADVAVSDVATWTDASTGAMFESTLWEPGYVEAKHIKINNVGTLALNYKLRIVANGTVSKLADVIDVYYVADATAAITRDNLGTKIGTLTEVLGTSKNLINTINGSLTAGETATWSLVLKMQETAGNEYQNLTVGTDFSVELIATQMSYEKDSFGPDYDAKVPSPELPAALVRPLDNLSVTYTTSFPNGTPAADPMQLAAGYQFEPTENLDEANISEYRHWHADYVVTADRDVAVNSIVLAGYYSAFCDDYNGGNWVALMDPTSTDVLTAGDEVRLVELMGGGAISVSYKDLCQWGNDGKGFQCGLAALDAAALAGTTITVELRMYEVEGEWSDSSNSNVETGEYQSIGVFTYTFPYVVNSAEGLKAALAAGATEITLAGDINMETATTKNERITIAKNTSVVIDLNGYTLTSKDGGSGNTMAIYVDEGATFTLEDSSENGTGKIVSSCYGIYVQPGATFIMNGGTLEVSGNGVYDMGVVVWNGEFIMNGGAITAKYGICTSNYWKNNGKPDAPVCKVTIADGCEVNGTDTDIDTIDAADTILDVPADIVVNYPEA